jgi:two-component system phosphate regulon sensor histidine kinase PhoR
MSKQSNITFHNDRAILESVARSSKNGFVAYNNQFQITYFSKRMEELTGWSRTEMLGQDVRELYAIKSADAVPGINEVNQQIVIIFTKTGKQITLEARITPIASDKQETEGFLVFFVIEDYKKNLDQAQSEFISTVSHELRTPITSIKGFAATLLGQADKLDLEKRTKYIKIIKDQAERLARLVEDLLAVSRMENKKLQLTLHPVRLEPVIEMIVEVVKSKHLKSKHKFDINIAPNLPEVWVDSDRLEQILTNLIDNAVKYSPDADKIEIKVRTTQKDGEEVVRVNITDYGIGIKPEDIKKIFTKFSRLDSPLTRVTEGTGLGLYISFSLAKLLHGDLSAKSETGKTTFSLFLPTKEHSGAEIWWD